MPCCPGVGIPAPTHLSPFLEEALAARAEQKEQPGPLSAGERAVQRRVRLRLDPEPLAQAVADEPALFRASWGDDDRSVLDTACPDPCALEGVVERVAEGCRRIAAAVLDDAVARVLACLCPGEAQPAPAAEYGGSDAPAGEDAKSRPSAKSGGRTARTEAAAGDRRTRRLDLLAGLAHEEALPVDERFAPTLAGWLLELCGLEEELAAADEVLGQHGGARARLQVARRHRGNAGRLRAARDTSCGDSLVTDADDVEWVSPPVLTLGRQGLEEVRLAGRLARLRAYDELGVFDELDRAVRDWQSGAFSPDDGAVDDLLAGLSTGARPWTSPSDRRALYRRVLDAPDVVGTWRAVGAHAAVLSLSSTSGTLGTELGFLDLLRESFRLAVGAVVGNRERHEVRRLNEQVVLALGVLRSRAGRAPAGVGVPGLAMTPRALVLAQRAQQEAVVFDWLSGDQVSFSELAIAAAALQELRVTGAGRGPGEPSEQGGLRIAPAVPA